MDGNKEKKGLVTGINDLVKKGTKGQKSLATKQLVYQENKISHISTHQLAIVAF